LKKYRDQVNKQAHTIILDMAENAHFSGSEGHDYLKYRHTPFSNILQFRDRPFSFTA